MICWSCCYWCCYSWYDATKCVVGNWWCIVGYCAVLVVIGGVDWFGVGIFGGALLLTVLWVMCCWYSMVCWSWCQRWCWLWCNWVGYCAIGNVLVVMMQRNNEDSLWTT